MVTASWLPPITAILSSRPPRLSGLDVAPVPAGSSNVVRPSVGEENGELESWSLSDPRSSAGPENSGVLSKTDHSTTPLLHYSRLLPLTVFCCTPVAGNFRSDGVMEFWSVGRPKPVARLPRHSVPVSRTCCVVRRLNARRSSARSTFVAPFGDLCICRRKLGGNGYIYFVDIFALSFEALGERRVRGGLGEGCWGRRTWCFAERSQCSRRRLTMDDGRLTKQYCETKPRNVQLESVYGTSGRGASEREVARKPQERDRTLVFQGIVKLACPLPFLC